MLFGEGVELLGQHPSGKLQRNVVRGRFELAVELQQQTFLKVARPHSRWVQLLHHLQHGLEFFFLDLNALTECQV